MNKIILIAILILQSCSINSTVTSIEPKNTEGLSVIKTVVYEHCSNSSKGEVMHWRKPFQKKVTWFRSNGTTIYISPGVYYLGFMCQHPLTEKSNCYESQLISTGKWPEKEVKIESNKTYTMKCDSSGQIIISE
jgi:hypothetical protein